MLEVIHFNRTATAGALSASIAHELNQPLGAILSNAEAAELLLAANPPDLDQVEGDSGDIRQADQRAADIIQHLRKLLKRTSEIEWQEFDLNDAIAQSIAHSLTGGDEARHHLVLRAASSVRSRCGPIRFIWSKSS